MALLVFAILITAILFPVFASSKGSRRRPEVSQMKQLAMALLIYAADHDEHMPLAENWLDASAAYSKTANLHKLPAEGDFWPRATFNRHVSGISIDWNASVSTVPMLFTSAIRDPNPVGDESNMIFPYHDNALVGFMDGHVAGLRPTRTKELIWSPPDPVDAGGDE